MVLFAVALRKLRCYVIWRHAILRLWVDIIVVSGLPIKFCSLGSIVQLLTKIFMSSLRHIIGAKEMEEFRRGKSSL